MSEQQEPYITTTMGTTPPVISTGGVTLVVSRQWAQVLNEAQRLLNSGAEQVIIRKYAGRLEIGYIVTFDSCRT